MRMQVILGTFPGFKPRIEQVGENRPGTGRECVLSLLIHKRCVHVEKGQEKGDKGIAWEAGFDPYPSTPPPTEYCRKILSAI